MFIDLARRGLLIAYIILAAFRLEIPLFFNRRSCLIWLIFLLFPAIVVSYEDYFLHTRYGKEYKSERTCSVFYAGIVVSMRK